MNSSKIYDYIILGAGPAGLQLGYFLQKEGHDFIIIEKNEVAGSFYKEYPRHRKLISINKVYTGYDDKEINLRYDWNSLLCDDDRFLFKNYSKEYFPDASLMVDYLRDFAEFYELPIQYGFHVATINKDQNFVVTDKTGRTLTCKRLIVATGWSKPYIPKIDGIEHGVHYNDMSINKEDYIGKRLLIIGKGNSAFETADDLIGVTATTHVCSPTTIDMAWQTHYVGNLRAVNNNFLDTYHLKSQNAVLDANIQYIKKEDGKYKVGIVYNNLAEEIEEQLYDSIILCTGFKFDASVFSEECKPKLTIKNRMPDQQSNYESVNVEDLYFAGAITHMRDYKKQASGFIHGFRYNTESLAKMLNEKYHGNSIPSTSMEWTPTALGDKILQRINQASSLWQQYGYIGDVAVVEDQEIVYYNSMPVDFIHEAIGKNKGEYYIITLEFGKSKKHHAHNSITRVDRNDYKNANLSKFLHPIVRRYVDGVLEYEHHIIEDLESEWKEKVHVEPLMEFLQSVKESSGKEKATS